MNIFCLGVYGVLQERVMTIPYESNKNDDESGTYYPDAIFTSSIFLVLSNRICALFVGGVKLLHFWKARVIIIIIVIVSRERSIGGGQIRVWRTTRAWRFQT